MTDSTGDHAKLAEQVERYEDMKNDMKSLVEKKKKLTDDERNLLSVAYKNVVGSRRSAWRIISAMEAKESEASKQATAERYRKNIEKELIEICDEVIKLLDDYLIPNITITDDNKNVESQVFFQKMKGDYFRYKVEVANDDNKEELKLSSQEAYNAATEAAKGMTPTNPIRLGLALNYSVFFYEIMNQTSKACELAKKAFDDAISELDQDGDNHDSKDSMLIMQLLRDNLTLWTQDDEEQQEAN